jgi:glycyl-radical enzyme activating protein
MKSLKEPLMVSDNMEDDIAGQIFSIQHFCLHDGPGIRSLVFFKGCPLRCAWCQNPESWTPSPELGFKTHLCINCRTCVSVCPANAMKTPGQIRSDLCQKCFACAEACPSGALIRFGNLLSTQAVLDELRSEYPYYQRSGGGVTFSGGEPALSAEFALQLAGALKQDRIHLAMETCGLFHMEEKPGPESKSRKAVRELLNLTDLVLFDIKLFQDSAHQQFCGAANLTIKNNLAMLARNFREEDGPLLWPRMPLIPGITDTPENLEGWGGLLSELGLSKITLVPFHNLGEAKREWLQLKPGLKLTAPTRESMEKARHTLARMGITCYDPGEEDWPQPVKPSSG